MISKIERLSYQRSVVAEWIDKPGAIFRFESPGTDPLHPKLPHLPFKNSHRNGLVLPSLLPEDVSSNRPRAVFRRYQQLVLRWMGGGFCSIFSTSRLISSVSSPDWLLFCHARQQIRFVWTSLIWTEVWSGILRWMVLTEHDDWFSHIDHDYVWAVVSKNLWRWDLQMFGLMWWLWWTAQLLSTQWWTCIQRTRVHCLWPSSAKKDGNFSLRTRRWHFTENERREDLITGHSLYAGIMI